MKSLIISTSFLFFSMTTQAYMSGPVRSGERLCPTTTTEIVICVADASLPVFPFAAICQDAHGAQSLYLDPGATNQPYVYAVTRAETNDSTIWTAVDKSGPIRFRLLKPADSVASLKINMGLERGSDSGFSYKCGRR